jgi:hypothetical protein
MNRTQKNNAVYWTFDKKQGEVTFFDKNDKILGTYDELHVTWDIQELPQKIDFKFVLNEDYNICVVFDDGCLKIHAILNADFEKNRLEIDNEKHIWLPPSDRVRYLKMSKIVSTLKVFQSLKRLLEDAD